jgi:hypothetical protein
MRGEVQEPGTVAPGHNRYDSGLRDRPCCSRSSHDAGPRIPPPAGLGVPAGNRRVREASCEPQRCREHLVAALGACPRRLTGGAYCRRDPRQRSAATPGISSSPLHVDTKATGPNNPPDRHDPEVADHLGRAWQLPRALGPCRCASTSLCRQGVSRAARGSPQGRAARNRYRINLECTLKDLVHES